MMAVRKDVICKQSPFEILTSLLPEYRKSKGLHTKNDTTVSDAITDLEIRNATLIPSNESSGFQQIE